MQLPLRIWDSSAPVALEAVPSQEGWAPRPVGRPAGFGTPKKIGFVAAATVHLLVAAALLVRWQVAQPVPLEPLTFVQIAEAAPETPLTVPPEPHLKPTKVDFTRVELPLVDEPTNAITVPREPAAPPPPPSTSALETYQAKLYRHLSRHKRYPAEAQRHRDQGVAMLSFTIDEQGRVLGFRLAKSSGFPALDEETLAMIQRANPVPVPPAGMISGRGDVVIPVEFSLR